MATAIPLVFLHARTSAGLLTSVVVGFAMLALLAFAVAWFIGIAPPLRPDGPELAPFRWGGQEWLA
jgi:hypothetical protein